MPKPKTDIDAAARALEAMSEPHDAPPITEHRTALVGDGDFVAHPFGFMGMLGTAGTGVTVTPQLAMTASAVYSCINVLATSIGSLPIHVVDLDGGGRIADHPAQDVLDEPNAYMTRAEFFEAFMVNLCGWGNGYAVAPRDPISFRVTELLPVLAANTEPRRKNGQLYYITQPENGGEAFTIRPENMVHTKNMSFNGLIGISPIDAARNTFGISLALEEFAGKFFKNGAAIQAVLELPKMSPEALEEFKRRWAGEYVGVENSHKMPAVPEIKVHKFGASPEEAQVVDSRIHQVREACRVYRVPPHKVADLEKSTFSNMEEQERDFATNSLGPWAMKIEQTLELILLRKAERRRRIGIRFNLDAKLRASTKDRYEAHAKACGSPFMTVNECRALENMPPIKGGDKLISPLNMTPAEKRQLRDAVEHGAGQAIRKQINAVKRAAKKHVSDAEGFGRWADEFFDEQRDLLARAMGNRDRFFVFASSDCDTAKAQAKRCFELGSIDEMLEVWEERVEDVARIAVEAE